MSEQHLVRLNKFIAQSGYCSRRQADELISSGKVLLNDRPVKEMGTKVDPGVDSVRIRGGPTLQKPQKRTIILMNKPKGYTCTKSDRFASRTVYELLPDKYRHLFTIGRLDRNTQGLLLFTNDGELANKLAHPSHGKEKTYMVTCRGQLNEKDLKTVRGGMRLMKYRVSPAKIKEVSFDEKKDRAVYEVIITEGKNRQIHNMFLALKHPVKKLVRSSFGQYHLGKLKPGDFSIHSS